MPKPRIAVTSTGWLPRMAGWNFQLRSAARILAVTSAGAGFQNAHVLQVAGSIEGAGDHHAGPWQAPGEISAHRRRGGEGSTKRMAGRTFVGKFHHHGTQRSIEISGVLFAPQKVLVRFESSSRSRSGDNGYAQCLPLFGRGMTGSLEIAGGGIRPKAGNRDLAGAAADVDAADGRSARGCVSSATRA